MMDADVLVVGAGPVGEVLLAMLAKKGVRTIAFEREKDVWPQPRAVHFDGETLRTFQSLDLGDAVSSITAPMRNYRMINSAGEILIDIATGELGDQGWLDDVMFHQPDVDRLIRGAVDGAGSVTLLCGHTVESIDQTEDGVSATVVTSSGERRTYTGKYLVGADGASSFVRRSLGTRYEELGPSNPWLVVDGVFREQPEDLPSMYFYGFHERPRLWCELPGRRRRMEFKVLPDDDLEQIVTPAWVATASDGLLNETNFEIDRTAVYTFRSCLAPEWRKGRIFLVGDAAHLAPPLFGQGLCSGIRDAANLSWKLDLVLRGAPQRLLDTYESERKPHARAWVEQATKMSGIIQSTDAKVAGFRDQHIREHPEDGVPSAPQLGAGLHAGVGRAGYISPQPSIDGPDRFDDGVGARFLIAATSVILAAVPEGVRELLSESGISVELDEQSAGIAELLSAVGAGAVVVRPDRYIYGTATTPAELTELLRELAAACVPVG